VAFIPAQNMVVAVTSNDGDIEHAEAAAWKVVETSSDQFNDLDEPARAIAAPAITNKMPTPAMLV
jgi:hypothetical protein